MTTLASTAADFVIVGGGIAGLRAASTLAASGRVVILTKAASTESNTGYAQGGIAVALGPGDSVERHVADTLAAGAGLCDESAVRVLVGEGPRYVRELIEWGAQFDRQPSGELVFGLEAAHSVHRILHAGDFTGREISRAMWQRVAGLDRISVITHACVTEVIVENGRAAGVRYFDQRGARGEVRGARVLLATGGGGQIFRETTNPAVATGDGVALAYHAGARVADLEFVQFHPTALSLAGAPRFLISEALRGEGARLINAGGERFMERYDAAGDLAPRDVVARGIVREIERTGGPVFLTLQHLDAARVRARFPTIAEMCGRVGLDLATDRIPVGPAAHYMMGGIDTDEWGRTSVPGLYAAGETACTGVQGANRLASNSLLEGLVFGARAGDAMLLEVEAAPLKADRVMVPGGPAQTADAVALDEAGVREVMWRDAGLFRTREGLTRAVTALESAYASARAAVASTDDRSPVAPSTASVAATPSHDGGAPAAASSPGGADEAKWQRLNLTTVALLVARGALRREESRGGHFRADFPARDDIHFRVHLAEQRGHFSN
ncbi:MAG: L-aspartate oxidase [Vicinamibacterales bacterium]